MKKRRRRKSLTLISHQKQINFKWIIDQSSGFKIYLLLPK